MFSKDSDELAKYKFKTVESYETEQNNVLLCTNFLITKPVDQDGFHRLILIQYMIKWMEGTPEYSFEIGEKPMEIGGVKKSEGPLIESVNSDEILRKEYKHTLRCFFPNPTKSLGSNANIRSNIL